MKFSFDLKKRVFVQTLVVLLIGLTLGFVFGQAIITPKPVNQSLAWHPLQQVSDGSPTQISVDSNNNGIIDKAENTNFATTATSANNALLFNSKNESQITKFECKLIYNGALATWNSNNLVHIYPPEYCMDHRCTIIVEDSSTGAVIRVADYFQTRSGWGNNIGLTTTGYNFWNIKSYKRTGGASMDNVDYGWNGDGVDQQMVNLPDAGAADSWIYDDWNTMPGTVDYSSLPTENTAVQWSIRNKPATTTRIYVCG